MDLLEQINRSGTTVLVSTHDQHIVDTMLKRVIELERGRVVSRDTRPSLVQSIPVCALPSHD
jgi:cell division transport system ATP-binding protein